MTTLTTMEEEPSGLTDMIVHLSMKIISLLTGESPASVSGDRVTIKLPALHCTKPERDTRDKILEVTSKITELLTGEVPVRCQDVAIYLCMEEREYLDEHKDLYKDVINEDQHLPLSLDGSNARSTPKRSSRTFYSQDSTQEGHTTPNQIEDLIVKIEVKEEPEEMDLIGGERSVEHDDLFLEISTDEQHSRSNKDSISSLHVEKDEAVKEDFPEGNVITLNLHPLQRSANLSSRLSTRGESFPGWSKRITERPSDKREESTSHPISHTLEEPYSCSECGKCFSVRSHLVKHERVHTGEKPYSCTECGKCFTFKSNLVTHKRLHTGERPYSCTECGKCFTRKSNLIMHEKLHTGVRPYTCPKCGKCFSSEINLMKHEKVHSGKKSHLCVECGKCFFSKADLTKHRRIHTGEKPYFCSECGKRFAYKSNLVTHSRRHTGERPYCCTECGKCFSDGSALVTHKILHTGEKPYSCLDCGKCFSRKSTLNRHKTLHTGERRHSCSECGKRFSQRYDLAAHEKIHTRRKKSNSSFELENVFATSQPF